MSFLNLEKKNILVLGLANRKSVAYAVGKSLIEEGANVIYSVRTPERRESVSKLVGDAPVYICDVEYPEQIERLAKEVGEKHGPIHGIVHSIAFANYSDGWKPFYETRREDFLQATGISCFSLVEIARAFKPYLDPKAS